MASMTKNLGKQCRQDFDAAHEAFAAREHRYNHEHFSMALRGRTPIEKLAARLAAPLAITRRSGQRPVSEHVLLTCPGGRA
jgi:hypothetical protein